jgi:predicted Fe-Mo cluster-binding NifX family protein
MTGMKVCVPITTSGSLDPRWGRADRVAVAEVDGGAIASWVEHEVGWGASHDSGTEGSHHARVATFLRHNGIEAVAVDHMGEGMVRMLTTMGIRIAPVPASDAGSARDAVERLF